MPARLETAALLGFGGASVAALAVTYKLGAHTASALIKPMLVDHGWTREAIKDAFNAVEKIRNPAAEQRLHNRSQRDLARRKGDPDHVESRLVRSIKGFSADLRREAVLVAAVTSPP